MLRGSLRLAACAACVYLLSAACGLDSQPVEVSLRESLPGAAGAAALDAEGPTARDAGSTPGDTFDLGSSGPDTPSCGDGQRQPEEACDDGNRRAGDGCSAGCELVEPGFSCDPPGRACMPFAVCGDGLVTLTEQCDDGNGSSGDGCSDLCGIELQATCEGEPSACSRTTCGDSLRQGSEGCDDGNTQAFDGCSARCEIEPTCAGTSCQRTCGDGFVVGEACDDGNTLDGDGCSADCQLEPGSVCRGAPRCELVAGQCTQRVSAIFRDFADIQPDFGDDVCNARAVGAVGTLLDATGKPVLGTGTAVTEACLSTPQNFAAWFTNSADRPTLAAELLLFDDGIGYTNRFGTEGQRFQVPLTVPAFDGSPLFFPLDPVSGPTAQPAPASIPVQYGVAEVTAESALFPGAPNHNFAFTSEMVVPFLYDSLEVSTLTIGADDDVWVFLNGRLALDLGGVHEPITGSLRIDGTVGSVTTTVLDGPAETATLAAADFGLIRGTVYLLSIFHAEREPPVSSLLLQMSGLERQPSQCNSTCGDAVLSFAEQCDDGVNDGGYGECGVGCKLGAYCGDGTTQPEFGETCDVGGSASSANCRGCRAVIGG